MKREINTDVLQANPNEKTMNNKIDLSKMPWSFVVCWNDECPLIETCLRHAVGKNLPDDKATAVAVNPHVADWQDGQCRHYKKIEFVRNAYGIRHLLDDVPKKSAAFLATQLRGALTNRLYYHYYHSRKPIPPEHQAFIREMFARFSPGVEVKFERYSDEIKWE